MTLDVKHDLCEGRVSVGAGCVGVARIGVGASYYGCVGRGNGHLQPEGDERRMRRSRILGSGLLGLLAAGALLATSASASEYNLKMLPEIGRCVRVGSHSEFRGPRCSRSEPGVGRYAWISGLSAKNKYTGTLRGPIELGTHSSTTSVNCSSATFEGEYTGPKNLTITNLVLTGCQSSGAKCETGVGSTGGEISANELDGELGFISHPKKLKLGWDLKPASGSTLASFECAATELSGKSLGGGIPRELQGSVIGKIEPIDHMTSEYAIVFLLVRGAQFPEKFEGGVKDTLTTQLGEKPPAMGKTRIATTFIARAFIKGEEAVELLGKCVGAGC